MSRRERFGGLGLVVAKEWSCFVASDRGMLGGYLFSVVVYGAVFAFNGPQEFIHAFWGVIYAAVVATMFGNTVFVSERISGAFEVLLTSGISRDAILGGKVAYCLLVAAVMGALSWLFAVLLSFIPGLPGVLFAGWEPGLFLAAALMSIGLIAWLSVELTSPRSIYIINMLLLSVSVGVAKALGFTDPALCLCFCAAGAAFLWRARQVFQGEKVIRPVNL